MICLSLCTILVVGQLDQIDRRDGHEPVDLASKIETLENWFDNLQTRIRKELSTKPGITVKEVLSKITGLPLLLKKEYESSIEKRIHGMRTETQIDDLFIVHLNSFSSFIDYGLVEHLIQKFGSDGLKKDMISYCNKMEVFMKETTIKQLIETDRFPGQTEIPPKFSFIEAKIGEDASKCTLEYLNKIRKKYCSEVKLSEIICHLVAVVESDSFIVRWLVPSALDDIIVKSSRNVDQSFYQEYKITSLTLDGMWIFLSDAEIDVIWLQMHSSDFESQFLTMYKQIVCELKAQDISEYELSSYLMNQYPKLQSNASFQLSEAFLKHAFPLSVLDFRVLSTVIDKFGSDCLKSVLKLFQLFHKYVISIYMRESTVEQLVSLPPIQSQPSKYFISIESRNREEPSDCRLARLLYFQARFCNIVNIDVVCFIMDKIVTEIGGHGSFFVKWYVPSSLALELLNQQRKYSD